MSSTTQSQIPFKPPFNPFKFTQQPSIKQIDKKLDENSSVEDRLVIIIVCNKFYLDILINKKVIVPKDMERFKRVFHKKDYTYGEVYNVKYMFKEKYNCNVILTDVLHLSTDNRLVYKEMFPNKEDSYKIYKYIYIIGDEEFGYHEMIQSCFYLGLGHQVILIIERIHNNKLFFGVDELKEIRSYPKRFLRSRGDYYGSIESFITNLNKNGLESIFKLRSIYKNQLENKENKRKVIRILDEYINNILKYKYKSFPKFTQNRIDFDAPYCSISNIEGNLIPISKVCKFTMEPLLKFSYYFGFVLRYSVLLYNREKLNISQRTFDTPLKYTEENVNVKEELEEEDNLSTTTLTTLTNRKNGNNLDIDNMNLYVNNNALFVDVVNKLNSYTEYLQKIEYLEVYKQQEEDEEEKLYGVKVFIKLNFDFNNMEDADLVKLNFVQYFITRKYPNGLWNKNELTLIKLNENTNEIDYEYEIQRDISKFIKSLFDKNISMKERLYELYNTVEKDKVNDIALYKKYDINKRLSYLYKYILGEDKVKELLTTSFIRDILEDKQYETKLGYIVYSDVSQDGKVKLYYIYDIDKTPDEIIKKYIEQKKLKNAEFKKKIEEDKKFLSKYAQENRLIELERYYPDMTREELIELYNKEKLDNKKNPQYMNKINQIIYDKQIPFIRLSSFFMMNINGNSYRIYVSSVPDNTTMRLFLNKLTIKVKIRCPNGILPPSEELLRTELLEEIGSDGEKKYYYKKKVYFVNEKPLAKNVIELPFDLSKYKYEEGKLEHIPRNVRKEELTKFKNIFLRKINSQYYIIKSPIKITLNEGKEMTLYLSSNENKKKKEDEIDNIKVSNDLLEKLIKPKGLELLFKPENIYLVSSNQQISYIYVSKKNYGIEPLIEMIKRIVKETLNIQLKIRETDIKEIEIKEELLFNDKNSIIDNNILLNNNDIDSNIDRDELGDIIPQEKLEKGYEILELSTEHPLTIIQGFYQFVSLTYLMDLFENLNSGRRFLKSLYDINKLYFMGQQQYDRLNWRNLKIPEILY